MSFQLKDSIFVAKTTEKHPIYRRPRSKGRRKTSAEKCLHFSLIFNFFAGEISSAKFSISTSEKRFFRTCITEIRRK